MSIRAMAVQEAKEQGLCTQCLKHPHADERLQCQRCIDTNRKKWREQKRRLAMGKWSKKAREMQSVRMKERYKIRMAEEKKFNTNGSSEGSIKSKVEDAKDKLGGLIEDLNTIINQLG